MGVLYHSCTAMGGVDRFVGTNPHLVQWAYHKKGLLLQEMVIPLVVELQVERYGHHL